MATNFATANYQEILDISTTPSKIGLFGIHTPSTLKPVGMLEGFFRQFRQFKYLGCSVKVQPAATLPADPLSVSYEAGDVSTDPRDLLNPILVKGCHGETINQALDSVYGNQMNFVSDSVDRTDIAFGTDSSQIETQSTQAYYTALSDPRFRKYNVLQPFALNGLHPLVHDVVGTMPIYPKQSANQWEVGNWDLDTDDETAQRVGSDLPYYQSGTAGNVPVGVISGVGGSKYGSRGAVNGTIFTNRMKKLGWLDTVSRPQQTAYVTAETGAQTPTDTGVSTGPLYKYNTVPKLFMSMMMMPPSYKSILTFRVVINHKFAFRNFSTAMIQGASNATPNLAYYQDLAEITTASTASVEALGGDVDEVTSGVY